MYRTIEELEEFVIIDINSTKDPRIQDSKLEVWRAIKRYSRIYIIGSGFISDGRGFLSDLYIKMYPGSFTNFISEAEDNELLSIESKYFERLNIPSIEGKYYGVKIKVRRVLSEFDNIYQDFVNRINTSPLYFYWGYQGEEIPQKKYLAQIEEVFQRARDEISNDIIKTTKSNKFRKRIAFLKTEDRLQKQKKQYITKQEEIISDLMPGLYGNSWYIPLDSLYKISVEFLIPPIKKEIDDYLSSLGKVSCKVFWVELESLLKRLSITEKSLEAVKEAVYKEHYRRKSESDGEVGISSGPGYTSTDSDDLRRTLAEFRDCVQRAYEEDNLSRYGSCTRCNAILTYHYKCRRCGELKPIRAKATPYG